MTFDTKSSQIGRTFGLAYSPLNSAMVSCSSEVTLRLQLLNGKFCFVFFPCKVQANSENQIPLFLLTSWRRLVWYFRPVGTGGAGCKPPDFGRAVNAISTRGADYAHHITTGPPPDFQTFLRPFHTTKIFSVFVEKFHRDWLL